MSVRRPSGILVSSIPPVFRCSSKSPEVGSQRSVQVHVSHFVPSLISLELYVRFFADKCIHMPANNSDPLIRRFNAPDREMGLNNLELEGRNAAEVSASRQGSKAFEMR